MSDIPRYKPVSNDRLGIADDADGKLCEYRDYEKLKSTVQSFAANVLRLGNEVRDLSISNAVLRDDNDKLKAELRKRALESLSDIGQLGEQSAEIASLKAELTDCKAEADRLKAEVERLEHQVRYWRIEAETDNARWLRSLEEVERLRASSFVTAVPVEQYERVIEAGDGVVERLRILGANSDYSMYFIKAWNAAKEGKPSV